MKILKFLALPLLFAAAVAATYLVASYLLENETERLILKRVREYENFYSADAMKSPVANSLDEARDSYPKIETAIGRRVLARLMKSGDPDTRIWCALIAAYNGMTREYIETLAALLIERPDAKTASRSWQLLTKYTETEEMRRRYGYSMPMFKPIRFEEATETDVRLLIEKAEKLIE